MKINEDLIKNVINIDTSIDSGSRINILHSKNLIDLNEITRDYYYTEEGNYVESAGSGLTDYMEVDANAEYVFKGVSSTSSNRRINFFNSSKQWLSQYVKLTANEDVITTTPANTKYVRISYYSPTMNESNIGYYKSPFVPSSINIDNEKFTETLGVGTSADSRNRVNFVKSKNLFDNKQIPIKKLFGSGTLNYTPINTGISVSYTANESASIVYKIIDVSNYVGEKITIKANYDDNSNGHYNIGLCDANGENRIVGGSSSASGQTITYTIPTITTSKYLALWFYCDKNGTVNYTNIMVNFGDTALPYEPYVTPSINVDGEEIYNKPVVLFNNPTGLFDDITLSDSKSNYSYLEIYFLDDQNFQNSMKIDTSNNMFQLQFVKGGITRGSMYFITTRMYWNSNTVIKRGTTTIYNIVNSVISENATADILKITKVIGYK